MATDGFLQIFIIGLVAAASAAVVITLYHCIPDRFLGWRSRQVSSPPEMHHEMSLDNSVAELLPAHKYEKGVGLIRVDDGTCAICLAEFEEGEELRTLPECVHSFHVVCIDMWLFSHSNCPMCRTFVGAAEQSAPTLMHLLDPGVAYNTNPIAT